MLPTTGTLIGEKLLQRLQRQNLSQAGLIRDYSLHTDPPHR